MGPIVVEGAMMMCSFGPAPGPLMVLPINRIMINGMPAASIMSHMPMVNILPFATCLSPANPTPPEPIPVKVCTPMIMAPWIPGAVNVLATEGPLLDETCTAICDYGGVIMIMVPMNFTIIAAS